MSAVPAATVEERPRHEAGNRAGSAMCQTGVLGDPAARNAGAISPISTDNKRFPADFSLINHYLPFNRISMVYGGSCLRVLTRKRTVRLPRASGATSRRVGIPRAVRPGRDVQNRRFMPHWAFQGYFGRQNAQATERRPTCDILLR